MKKIFLSLFLTAVYQLLFSQQPSVTLLKGRIVTEQGGAVTEARVALPHLKLLTVTDENGYFSFDSVKYGRYDMVIEDFDTVKITVTKAITDLGDLKIRSPQLTQELDFAMPVIFIGDDDGQAGEVNSGNYFVSGLLNASRHPFLSAAAFYFAPFGFKIRGYQPDQMELYMNGLLLNDIENGMAYWGQLGGLNDVFRNQSVAFGLAPAEDGFGRLSGAVAIDATAAAQNKQTKIAYGSANGSYRNRMTVGHSTGMLSNGWAAALAVSRRWAKEGYVPGTFYDGTAYYLGLSKQINGKSSLHFTSYGSSIRRGKAIAATQEAIDLAGDHYYNPAWGYLNGEKRNARINNSFLPVFMLNYTYRPNSTTQLRLGTSFQTGYDGNSVLDWYNAQDPRPDHYKNMPGYYLSGPAGTDPGMAEMVKQQWLEHPEKGQINWERLYEANRMNFETVNEMSGRRSLYVIGEDRSDENKYNFSALFHKNAGNKIIHLGFNFVHQEKRRYRKMLDLLGGDYYVNLNQFAERAFIGNREFMQNDLNHPDEIIKEGDKYMYNYIARFNKGLLWGQSIFHYNQFDFFVTARAGSDFMRREGLYRNGLFQDDSYGKSGLKSFFTYALKGGSTYKIDGRNHIVLNAAYLTGAPVFDHVFLSPRVRNTLIDNAKPYGMASLEGGYVLSMPRVRTRLWAFVTETKGAGKTQRYYNEAYRNFVNYVIRGINIRNLGAELDLQAKLTPSLSLDLVATWMQVFYTSRPDISIYLDNDTGNIVDGSTVYWENYFAVSGPQSAYALGLSYRSFRWGYAHLSFHFLDRYYLEVNPNRLTAEAIDLMPEGSIERAKVLQQEKLPSIFSVDLFFGKNFSLNKIVGWLPFGSSFTMNLGVSNLLNNSNIIAGGFPQLRFDYTTRDPDRFPSKYAYGYGRSYFLNVGLRF